MSSYIERNNMGGDQPHGDPQHRGSSQEAKSNQDQQRAPYPGSNSGMSQGTNPGVGGMNQGSMNQGNMQPMQQGNGGMQQGGMAGQSAQSANGSGTDYRDDLRSLLDKAHAEKGLTRYRLCKQMGIDSGTLSNVLAKRRHFSLEKLEQILQLLGYRLSFTQDESLAQ